MRFRRAVGVVAAMACVAGCSPSSTTPVSTTAPPPTTATSSPPPPPATSVTVRSRHDAALPPPVAIRSTPDGITLADPTFAALDGAHAEFGPLGGTVYQIEIPDHWNGRLVLFMHGYGELRAQGAVTPPPLRHALIADGDAWAASSMSSTSIIPGRAADETAALWDHFVAVHGRPSWTYITGTSMGGWAATIAAERYADRFDGALALCGAAGLPDGARISVDQFVAAAYVAGVSQAEFDSTDVGALIDQRIEPALADPSRHDQFERLMVALNGGPRAFDRAGIHLEEARNFARARLLIAAHGSPSRTGPYVLGPGAGVSETDFNHDALAIPAGDLATTLWAGDDVSGDLQIPLLTMHTTGDGQVPINQAQVLLRHVTAAGRADLLVQRVVQDPGHCGFSSTEQKAAFDALVDWVEQQRRPTGTDLAVNDLTRLDHTFELSSRSLTSTDHVDVAGHATLDGAPLTSRFIGAVVVADGLVTPCQAAIPTIDDGRYTIPVYNQDTAAGCGRPGAEIVLWTSAADQILYATSPIPWPDGTTTTADVAFSTADVDGAAPPTIQVFGSVYDQHGGPMPAGTLVEAYIGATRCAVASTRTGSFTGYIVAIVGPDTEPGCAAGQPVMFRVNGNPTVGTHVIADATHRDPVDLTLAG